MTMRREAVAQGNVGAGVGASVGKALGLAHACKSGLGSASLVTPEGLVVGALAVVNAFGAVSDPATGHTLAGIRRLDASGAFAGEAYDYDPYNLIDWHSGFLGTWKWVIVHTHPQQGWRGGET